MRNQQRASERSHRWWWNPPAFLVAVVPDLPDGRLTAHDRDVLAAAVGIAHAGVATGREATAGAVLAVTFEPPRDDLGLAGADRVMHFSPETRAGFPPEWRLSALCGLLEGHCIEHVLFPESEHGGGDLARRLAARLGDRAATAAWRADDVEVVRRAGGGSHDVTMPLPKVVALLPEAAEPIEGVRHEAREMPSPTSPTSSTSPTSPTSPTFPSPSPSPSPSPETHDATPQCVANRDAIQDMGLLPADLESVPLAEAEFIVAAGDGVRDWPGFTNLARRLGASVGGSRVVVDAGHLPRERQVGASGTLVTARCYLALAISGAPQHLEGIAACDQVIAVNRDPGCDMMKRADLAVVGDVDAIVPALLLLAGGGE